MAKKDSWLLERARSSMSNPASFDSHLIFRIRIAQCSSIRYAILAARGHSSSSSLVGEADMTMASGSEDTARQVVFQLAPSRTRGEGPRALPLDPRRPSSRAAWRIHPERFLRHDLLLMNHASPEAAAKGGTRASPRPRAEPRNQPVVSRATPGGDVVSRCYLRHRKDAISGELEANCVRASVADHP